MLAVYLSSEAYALFLDSGKYVTFLDGKTHQVSVQWYIKGLTDILMYCTLCIVICAASIYPDKRYIALGSTLFVYHVISFIFYMYNYSTSKIAYYILLAVIIIILVHDVWPHHKGRIIKMFRS